MVLYKGRLAYVFWLEELLDVCKESLKENCMSLRKQALALLLMLGLFTPRAIHAQSIFSTHPILLTWDRSTQDTLEYPKGVYFTYRSTFNPLTGGCNAFTKIGGSGLNTSYLDTQVIAGIMYCYKEAFYNGTQSPQSDPPVVVLAQ